MIQIRKICSEDLCLVEGWERQGEISQYLSHIRPRCFREGAVFDEVHTKWYLIEKDNLPIGAVWLEDIIENKAKLSLFIADPAERNKGWGKMVIEQIKEMAFREWELAEIYLRVRQNNRRAINCCKRCGFEVIKEYPKMRFTDGTYQAIYEMHIRQGGS